MLSVLLLILKILLLTIAILLGIILLFLLSFLFLPFCYQFYGKYENEGYMEGSIRWILFVIHFKTSYEHEELTYDLKSFGYTIYSNREEWQAKHNKEPGRFSFRREKGKKEKKGAWKEKKVGWKENGENTSSSVHPEPLEEKKLFLPEEGERNQIPEHAEKKVRGRKRKHILSRYADILNKLRLILKKIWSLFSYFFYFPWKIKEKIFLGIEKAAGVWHKVKPLFKKLDLWKKFLKQKSTKEAIRHLISHLKFLWKGVKPKKFFGEFHFGFEEPDKTGKVLGILGCAYGAIRNYIKVIPYFDEKILKGSFYGKGRIRVFHLIRTGVKVYKDKLLMKKWEQLQKLMEQ